MPLKLDSYPYRMIDTGKLPTSRMPIDAGIPNDSQALGLNTVDQSSIPRIAEETKSSAHLADTLGATRTVHDLSGRGFGFEDVIGWLSALPQSTVGQLSLARNHL